MQQNRTIDFTNLKQLKQGYDEMELSIWKFQDKKKCILYLNLTHDETIQPKIKRLISNPQELENGFFGNFIDNQEIINFYYFQNLCQIDKWCTIDLKELSKFKIFLLHLVQKLTLIHLKVVLHSYSIQIEQQKEIIDGQVFQLFDGLDIDLSNIIYISNDLKGENIVGYARNKNCKNLAVGSQQELKVKKFQVNTIRSMIDKVIHNGFYENQLPIYQETRKFFQCQQFETQFIRNLNEVNYQIFQFNEYSSVGVDCYMYISKEMQVIYDQVAKNLQQFQIKIQELLELPVNLNYESNQVKDAQEFSMCLFSMINEFDNVIKTISINTLQSTFKNLHEIIEKFESPILKQLRCLAQQHNELSKYKNVQNFFDRSVLVNEDDQKSIIFFQNYQETILFQDFVIMEQQNFLWTKYFKQYLPQCLKYFQLYESIFDKKIDKDKPKVVILGLTKVGKSTLLNNLINPQNMKIISNEQIKSFDVIVKNPEIQISQTCSSETQDIVIQEIDKIQFIDTPGFYDTTAEKRLLNQLMIFNQLQNSKQVIFLIVIDGYQWTRIKNDLIETLKQINTFFGDKLDKDVLNKCVLPVFNKLRVNTMEEIINKWQAEIIKDQEDNNIKTFLDIIKDKIDKDFYIKILDAEQYQDTDEINNLNQQIEEIEKKIKPLREQKQKDDKQLFNLLNDKDQLEQELKDKKGKSIDFGKLQKIKDILIDKCKTLQQEQNESQIKFEFSLKLNAEMQDMYNKIIQHQDEICSQILCMMTNIILKDLLKDDSEKKIDDIIKISKDIQNQIKNYNQKEDHNIFQFFDYLSEQFQDIFQAQHLMNEQIKQLKIVDLISGLVENGKKINKIKILILDEHLEKLIQAYTNVQNIKLPFLEWIGKHLKILYARIFSSKEKVDELKSDYLVRLEKLKFLNLKIEYNKPNS